MHWPQLCEIDVFRIQFNDNQSILNRFAVNTYLHSRVPTIGTPLDDTENGISTIRYYSLVSIDPEGREANALATSLLSIYESTIPE